MLKLMRADSSRQYEIFNHARGLVDTEGMEKALDYIS